MVLKLIESSKPISLNTEFIIEFNLTKVEID